MKILSNCGGSSAGDRGWLEAGQGVEVGGTYGYFLVAAIIGFSFTVHSKVMLAACKKGKTNAIGTRSPRNRLTGLIRLVDSSTGALKVDMLIQAYRQLGNCEYMKLRSVFEKFLNAVCGQCGYKRDRGYGELGRPVQVECGKSRWKSGRAAVPQSLGVMFNSIK